MLSLLFLAPLAARAEAGCRLLDSGQVSALSVDGSQLVAAGRDGVRLLEDTGTSTTVTDSIQGAAVSVYGDWMAVGAPTEGGAGVVHLYQNEEGVWKTRMTLTGSSRPGSRFGASVALGDRWLVVGAPEDGAVREGIVYVFSSPDWTLEKELPSGDGRLADRFGASVAVDGDMIAVGAPYADDLKKYYNFGAVYVFTAPDWSRPAKLRAAETFRDGDIQFGASVAVLKPRLVVGAPGDDPMNSESAGTAWLFTLGNGTWSAGTELVPEPAPSPGRQLGTSVAIDESFIAVGAPFGGSGGAVHRFNLNGTWKDLCTGCNGGELGRSVALRKGTAFLGGPGGAGGCLDKPPEPVKLSLSMTAPEAACPDETATYTITVTNSGSEPVRGFKLETRVEPLKALRSSNRTCQPAAGSKGASCETRNRDAILPSGASLVYTLKGTIPHNAQGSFTVTASVEPPDGFKNLGSPSTVTTTTGILGEAACTPLPNTLTVLCGIDGSLRQETLATYDFLLQGGPGQTGPVRSELTDTFPENLPLFEVSATSGKISALEGVVSWQGEVDPGKAVGIRLRALIWKTEAGTKLCNQAKVSYDSDGDGVLDASVLSDDPNVPGAADACCFTVLPAAAVEGIPTLSDVALAALALFLAALSVRRLRAGPAIPSGGR